MSVLIPKSVDRSSAINLDAGDHTSDGVAGNYILPSGVIDLEDLEKRLLKEALERSRFNQTKAARLLHVTRHTLRYRLEKFGLLQGAVS